MREARKLRASNRKKQKVDGPVKMKKRKVGRPAKEKVMSNVPVSQTEIDLFFNRKK